MFFVITESEVTLLGNQEYISNSLEDNAKNSSKNYVETKILKNIQDVKDLWISP